MEVKRLTRSIGAVISGVDLKARVTDGEFAAIQDALATHQVVFFRDQDLSDDEHRAFARRFGPLSPDALAMFTGDTRDVMYIEDTPDNPPAADRWHTDIAWVETPPSLGMLNARVIPDYGGDTMWASLYAAYELLSPRMRAFCDELTVVNRAGGAFLTSAMRAAGDEQRVLEAFPPIEHPLVRTHPVSGRPALFLTATMDHVVGLTRAESDTLIAHLRSLLNEPNIQVRWRWAPHDFVIWDQASTNHRALSDHFPQHRRMRRCTIEGGRPFHRKAA